jgi:PAS domain S-box-containing protein
MPHTDLLLREHAAPARAAASITIVLGLAGVAGWVFGIPVLTRIIPGAVDMKMNTGLGLVFGGAALLILIDPAPRRFDGIARAICMALVLLGLCTLAEYAVGLNLGIDELLMKDAATAYNAFHGRISPMSAIAFATVGCALFALQHRPSFARFGAGCVVAIGSIGLLGYVWAAGEITTDRWLPPVALSTAAAFVLLGIGILLAPAGPQLDSARQRASLGAVEAKILSGFVIALSLLLAGGTYTYRANAQFADAMAWVAHTQEVRTSLASLYGSLSGSEVALRDYLLTADTFHRAEYRLLADEVGRHLHELESLIADNSAQQGDLQALELLVNARLDALRSVLKAYDDFGLPAARAVMARGRSTLSTQSVRLFTDRMDSREERLRMNRQTDTEHERRAMLASLLVTVAVACALFIVLFRSIHAEMLARRDAESALRASDHYNRSIIDASPDCLAVLTIQGGLMQMTPQGCKLLDIEDFASIAGRDWLAQWQGEDRGAATAAVTAARDGKDGRFQGFCATQKGTPKWWDVIVMPIFGGDGKPERLLTVARDITEVKRTADELVEANRFLDSLIENLPAMIVVKDAATLEFVRQNRAFDEFLGLSRDESRGKGASDLFGAEEADLIIATDRAAIDGGRLVDIPEQTIVTKTLGARTFHTMKLPITDGHGKPQFLLAISTDITERKLAEQAIRELNSALETQAAQLLASNQELESFSYSVSHDLRAPLRAIDGFALMIEEDYVDRLDQEGRRYLAVIRENAKRMGGLIDDLLEFSRVGRLPVLTRNINVDALVREVAAELVNENSLGTELHIRPLPPARGDPGLLRQVWTNLLSNALKYSGKSVRPRIEVSGRQSELESLYSIRDNGVGFDMAYAGKLFGVFQRLHRADEFDGTGVGLAIVHRVVTRHGGRIWAQGKVNEGATFSFALPRGELDE